jgi:hypothetical protein
MRWFSRPPDRRRSARFKADVPIIASLINDREVIPLRVRCHSISETGISTSGLSSLKADEKVTLELHIPVSTHAIWVEAVVRRSGEPCALEFVCLNDEQRNLIKRYCRLQPEEKRRR